MLAQMLFLALLPQSAPVLGAHHAALSPDGKTVAFSYRGDIWTVQSSGGSATRITIHPAHDTRPQFSPDGTKIAFSSNRTGGYDVYVVDASGGRPTRLTFHSAADNVVDWTPDGNRVLFLSSRDGERTAVHDVEVATGATHKITDENYQSYYGAAMSPDGKNLALFRGASAWYRKRYKGGGQSDIWLYNPADKQYKKLTSYEGQDNWPTWTPDGKGIVFASERSGAVNLWRMSASGGSATQLTKYDKGMVLNPSAARKSGDIVFEQLGRLHILPPAGQERVLDFQAPSDDIANLVEKRPTNALSGDLAVSPDGTKAAFVIHGDIFTVKTDGGDAVQLTETNWIETLPQWSPNGKQIAYLSDKDGNPQIWIMNADGTGQKAATTGGARKERLMFSPDGKLIYYLVGPYGAALFRIPVDGGAEVKVHPGPGVDSLAFSPDGKWLVVSREDAAESNDLVLLRTDLSEEGVNITRKPGENTGVRWTPDGKGLLYTFRPTWRRGLDPALYYLSLDRAPDKLGEEDDKKKDEKTDTKVDLEDIHTRSKLIAGLPAQSASFALSPDGKTVLFMAAPDGTRRFYTVGVDGEGMKPIGTLQTVLDLQFAKDPKKALYVGPGGSIRTISTDGTAGSVSFTADVAVDKSAEVQTLFNEAFYALKDYFYDPALHGAEWDALRPYYARLVAQCVTNEDLTYIFSQMLGELAASHLGFTAGSEATTRPTGVLGVEFDETYSGPGALVRKVIRRTPASRTESKLQSGEAILEVNGKPVRHTESLHELLEGTVGKVVTLKVAKDATGVGARSVKIRPIGMGDFGDILYDNWVDQRREMVSKLSGGKLYYMHIRSMNQPSLERFERELWGDAQNYQGLVLDVRNNGGGHIDEFLVSALARRKYSTREYRGQGREKPEPPKIWERPVALLINEYSASNSEIFADAFRTLKFGKIVGTPTSASVIGTSSRTLYDGRTSVRIPFVWWRRLDGTTMEGSAVEPDILVIPGAADLVSDGDPQLERAVKVLGG